MKLTQVDKKFESNADFTSEDFTIGDVSVVIEILRNKLYRHKIRTLVQEYISNARDATREINGQQRIEVTVPTMYTPTFKVRDFGPGISPDRMYNVFIKYASSTKRKDNVQTGGFGIGAKSAWSYTESFSIVTFIDGVQRTYVAHIGANNNGRLDYLGEVATDAANGTEIQIPVSPKDTTEFKRAAYRAVHFWSEAERPTFVNVNAQDIEPYVQGERVGNVEIAKELPDYIVNKYDNGIVIAIDGIPYVAGSDLIEKVTSLNKVSKAITGRLVLHLKNGDLEVSASREEISDSKATLDALETFGATTLKTIKGELTKAFAKATTPFEHLSIYMSLKDKFNLEAYRKVGDFIVADKNAIESDLFEKIKIELAHIAQPKGLLEKDNLKKSGRSRYYSRKPSIQSHQFDSIYFASGTETALITNYRLKALLASQHKTVIVLTKTDADTGEFDKVCKGLGAKDLSKVDYTKPARKTRETIQVERTKQEFCIHDMSRYSNKAKYITNESNTQKWLWVERSADANHNELSSLNDFLSPKGYKVCSVGQDAMRRIKNDSNFEKLEDFLKKFQASKEDIQALKANTAKNTDLMEKLSRLNGLKNKHIVKMLVEYKGLVKARRDLPERIVKLIGKNAEVEAFKDADAILTTELKRFSLLERIHWPHRGEDLEEIVIYMNAKK